MMNNSRGYLSSFILRNTQKLNTSPLQFVISKQNYQHHFVHQDGTVTRHTSAFSTSTSERRIGIGGSHKLMASPSEYASVIRTALNQSINTFDSPFNGETALAEAFQAALGGSSIPIPSSSSNTHEDESDGFVTMTSKVGYRTIPSNTSEETNSEAVLMDGDVVVTPPQGNKATSSDGAAHNISSEYIAQYVTDNPLTKLNESRNMQYIPLVHNPEEQYASMLSSNMHPKSNTIPTIPTKDEIHALVQERLTQAFIEMERLVALGSIPGYGVSSNGMCLNVDHPLHLDWKDVFQASRDAAQIVHGNDNNNNSTTTTLPLHQSNLKVLQLPANLLETRGIQIVNNIRTYLLQPLKEQRRESNTEHTTAAVPTPTPTQPFEIHITRPLTCYPDRGTGTGHPFRLVDYEIDTMLSASIDNGKHGVGAVKQWTQLMDKGGSPPPIYQTALNTAMGYFDAEHLIESATERELSPEERDTLDGCRLIQTLISDLDVELSSVRSFAAYEDNLFTKVIPFLHDRFEGLDDESAGVLQAYFAAHGSAVRRAVAHTTRKLLRNGGDGVEPYDIPDAMELQTFALQWLLRKHAHDRRILMEGINPDTISSVLQIKVMVGCSNALQVLDAVQAEHGLE